MAGNQLTQVVATRYPIIQAGMIWCSGWELASTVSNAGGLGVIGAGSMYPDVLDDQIQKCRQATKQPFAVNLPLIYPDIDQHVETLLKHRVPIVITSAGNPNTWTRQLKSEGVKVLHVVASVKFALKAAAAGVDAVIAEGFEAGGHNGADEMTTFALIPIIKKKVAVPVVAAGGIATGRGMLAAMVLGADGVQIGSRFVASHESSAHSNFKHMVVQARDGETCLTLKELTPVRMIKNAFYEQIDKAYQRRASVDELKQLLGRGRAKKGMFEGDTTEGELEIGQIAGLIDDIKPAAQIVTEIVSEYNAAKKALPLDL